MDSLFLGFSVGLAAGLAPGPLLTLVISATLERGFGAGLKVASAPLLSDFPIVAASLWLLAGVGEGFLTAIAVLGGGVVMLLGAETAYRAWKPKPAAAAPLGGDLTRGLLVNFLNPHPWIFWFTIGAPAVVALWRSEPPLAVGYLGLFYGALVGSKVAVAGLVAGGRGRLEGRGYCAVLGACGVLLVALGALLVAGGIEGVRR